MPESESETLLNRRSLLTIGCGVTLIAPSLAGWGREDRTAPQLPQELSVNAGLLVLGFRLSETGLKLSRIANQATGVEHLSSPSQLFGISCGLDEGFKKSDKDFRVDGVELSGGGGSLRITGRATALPISFTLSVTAQQQQENVALVKLELRNNGSTRLACRVRGPWIEGLALKGRNGSMRVALPQEAGGVVTTDGVTADLGMQANPKLGIPTAMNTMELLSLYDPDGRGGVFFSDAEADLDIGCAPIQFSFVFDTVYGHSLLDLQPGEAKALPAFALGVHETGDWHYAVDDYCRRHRQHWNFPDSPSWFRDQGAIYSFSGSGGGSIYMMFAQQNLKGRIDSFEQLPSLLEEAQSLGTNILYLWDYWEGAKKGDKPPYWNKGDYIPRADLGGTRAFREGIRQIHERGGRIILYVEPFVTYYYSHFGEEKGEQWAGRDAAGRLYDQYPENYSMVPCFRPWQDYVAEVSTKLVHDFGADGIYLDSWGWQLNWPAQTGQEKVLYSPLQYSLGVLSLAKRVRTAIRAVKADAIVMGESTSGALGRYWDGGLSADFAWLGPQNGYQIRGSPVRYAMPEMNVFSNGRNVGEMNQIFAAGYHLALLNANLPDANYIRKLVKIRQDYKDALIYGKQLFQPRTEDENVTAYYYRGATNEVITVSNGGWRNYDGKLLLTSSTESRWQDLLSPDVLIATDGSLGVEVPAAGLLVLARLH